MLCKRKRTTRGPTNKTRRERELRSTIVCDIVQFMPKNSGRIVSSDTVKEVIPINYGPKNPNHKSTAILRYS